MTWHVIAGLLLLAVVGMANSGHEVVIGLDAAGACRATFDGVPFPVDADDDAAATRLGSAAGAGRAVRVRADPAVGERLPNRCVGGVIYRVQRAGYELAIGFISGPPPSR